MKKTIRALSVLLAAIMLLACATALAEDPDASLTHAELITKYSALDLTPYQGKVLYLNFFTEWCPYCMDEMPSIKKLYETYSPDALQVILVHVWDGEDQSNSDSIIKTYGLEDMTFFEDKDMKLSTLLSLTSYPLSVFFGKDGNIAVGGSGALTYEKMAATLDKLEVPLKGAGE